MGLQSYGSWAADEFENWVQNFDPAWECDEGDIAHHVEILRRNGWYDSFVSAFKEFLLDDSLSLGQKATTYFEDEWQSGETWDYFKWIWEHLAPGEPWPLEGRPRPEDELMPRRHEFKPD